MVPTDALKHSDQDAFWVTKPDALSVQRVCVRGAEFQFWVILKMRLV